MSVRSRYQARADRRMDYLETHAPARAPLTANQHILHLLLTVFTAGLWLPVWIIRGIRGNRSTVDLTRDVL